MAQSKSISKKELDTLQGFVNEANKFQMQIGGVEAHKAQLIKACLLYTSPSPRD